MILKTIILIIDMIKRIYIASTLDNISVKTIPPTKAPIDSRPYILPTVNLPLTYDTAKGNCIPITKHNGNNINAVAKTVLLREITSPNPADIKNLSNFTTMNEGRRRIAIIRNDNGNIFL
jgi:hypothetical protein